MSNKKTSLHSGTVRISEHAPMTLSITVYNRCRSAATGWLLGWGRSDVCERFFPAGAARQARVRHLGRSGPPRRSDGDKMSALQI
jgi:hypothetical protein